MTTYTDPTVVAVGQPTKVQPAAFIALFAGIIAVAYGGFVYWKTLDYQNQKTTVEQEIVQHKGELDSLQPVATNLSELSTQAQGLHTIFDNQIRWEAVLGKIQDRLYKNMTVTALQVNSDGTATLSGTTSDYTNYAKIFRSLTDAEAQKTFSQAQPTAISRTETKEGVPNLVVFSFSLTLNPDLLKMTTSNTQ